MNILKSCTFYTINLLKISMDLRNKIDKDYCSLDADCMSIDMSAEDIEKFEIPIEAIDYDSEEFEEDMLEDILLSYIGNHPYYLVFASGCRWNGTSGYKITSKIVETIYRPYDVSIDYKSSIDNRALICTESSHDVPMGSETYIIGISNDEYEKLEEMNFDEIEKFVHDIVEDK